jgi:hypothetical protein
MYTKNLFLPAKAIISNGYLNNSCKIILSLKAIGNIFATQKKLYDQKSNEHCTGYCCLCSELQQGQR